MQLFQAEEFTGEQISTDGEMPTEEDENARVQLTGILCKRPVSVTTKQGGIVANKFYRRYVLVEVNRQPTLRIHYPTHYIYRPTPRVSTNTITHATYTRSTHTPHTL